VQSNSAALGPLTKRLDFGIRARMNRNGKSNLATIEFGGGNRLEIHKYLLCKLLDGFGIGQFCSGNRDGRQLVRIFLAASGHKKSNPENGRDDPLPETNK